MYIGTEFLSLIKGSPQAVSIISGSADFPKIRGEMQLYPTNAGTIVATQVKGLPEEVGENANPVFAFHIHSGESCTGNEQDPFADAGTHYNPKGLLHPFHAGDMPPLFGCGGNAFSVFLTDRFSVDEVIGKTVIIHLLPDDFKTQPAGGAGTKIACGIIRKKDEV